MRHFAFRQRMFDKDGFDRLQIEFRDFLIDELPARIERGAVTFHLKAQLASPGDSTKDASTPWPNNDEVVELGVLTIDKAARDSLEAQKKLLFLPGQLTDGIEPSDDPLIGLRDGAYAVSFSRRNPKKNEPFLSWFKKQVGRVPRGWRQRSGRFWPSRQDV